MEKSLSPTDEQQAAAPLPLSGLLQEIIDQDGVDRFTLTEFATALRDRTWGGLLVLFAAINILPLPPGSTVITGIPLVLLSAQMTRGLVSPWFPRKLDQRGISKTELTSVLAKLLPWERRLERFSKPRAVWLTSHRSTRVIGAICLLLSVILWLPIPFGNHAPALAMTLYALALINRDGVLVILGFAATILSLILVSLSVGAAWLAFLAFSHGLIGV